MSDVTVSARPEYARVNWLVGWYATRLHAVPNCLIVSGASSQHAVCGAEVYLRPKTDWAERKVAKGVRRCKQCERILAKTLVPEPAWTPYVYRMVEHGAEHIFEIGECDTPRSYDGWCDRRVCEGFWGDERQCRWVVDAMNAYARAGNKVRTGRY